MDSNAIVQLCILIMSTLLLYRLSQPFDILQAHLDVLSHHLETVSAMSSADVDGAQLDQIACRSEIRLDFRYLSTPNRLQHATASAMLRQRLVENSIETNEALSLKLLELGDGFTAHEVLCVLRPVGLWYPQAFPACYTSGVVEAEV